jgi:hypothetical protein
MLDWLYRVVEEERGRVTELCREAGVGEGEETNHQLAVRERARNYLAALARTAVEEHAELTPAALRSLADLLERGGAAADREVAEGVASSEEQGPESAGPR